MVTADPNARPLMIWSRPDSALHHALQASGRALSLWTHSRALPSLKGEPFLVDLAALDEAERTFLFDVLPALEPATPLLLITPAQKRTELWELLKCGVAVQWISWDPGDSLERLDVALRDRRELDAFEAGVEGVWRHFRLTRSEDAPGALIEVETFARQAGVPERFVPLLRTVTDELVANALFDAPVDGAGKPRFRHLPRTASVELAPQEGIDLRIGWVDRRLFIRATDPFGSLPARAVVEHLGRGLRQGADQISGKPGGAGLGLYFIFSSLTALAVRIVRGQRTEVQGEIDARGTYGDFVRSRGLSFQLSVRNRETDTDVDATPTAALF